MCLRRMFPNRCLVCLLSQLIMAASAENIMVRVVNLHLDVTEGDPVSVCVVIDPFPPVSQIPGPTLNLQSKVSLFPQTLYINVEFNTADIDDLSPDFPATLLLLSTDEQQCVELHTLCNDNAHSTEKTFAVVFSGSDAVVLTTARSNITIHGATRSPILNVTSLVRVAEGNTTVVCITAEFPCHSPDQLLMLHLELKDISTSASDYDHSPFPVSFPLSRTTPELCLGIGTYINDDGPGVTAETFQILVAPQNLTILVIIEEQCLEGELQLVNGRDEGEGRVEVCRGGEFWDVCDTNWTVENSIVVCNQLGYVMEQNTNALPKIFGEVSGPTSLDRVQCTGNEAKLLDCFFDTATRCDHSVGVHCTLPSLSQRADIGCVKGDVLPLIGGLSSREGFVEVCAGAGYFPLDVASFTIREANVLCRQMELGSAGFPISANDLGLKLLDEIEFLEVAVVECAGDEQGIAECNVTLGGTKPYSAVVCKDADPCSDGDIRLVPVISPPSQFNQGRVELCFQGVWGAVFDTDWSALDAAVTCQQLGFAPKGALPIVPAVYPNVTPFLPVVIDFPACDSTEYASLLDCPRAPVVCPGTSLPQTDLTSSGSGSGSGDEGEPFISTLGKLTSSGQIGTRALDGVVGVRCEDYTESECQEFSVRMTFREMTEAAGNLEICYGNEWNIMCADLLDQNVLDVVCRALGFTAFEQSIADHRFLPTIAFVLETAFEKKFNCSGTESSLSECDIEVAPARNTTISLCLDVRIQCLALPRILFSPWGYSNTTSVSVEEHRRASLVCSVSEDSYPPVTQLTALPSTPQYTETCGHSCNTSSYCLSAQLYTTVNASLEDSGVYTCVITSGGLTTSQNVTLSVQGPDLSQATSEYLRFSAFSNMLPDPIHDPVFNSISANAPGQQRVQCQQVTRRPRDKAAGLHRYQCIVLTTGPPQVSVAAAAILERFYPVIEMINTSALGFCDFSQTEYRGETYPWPESLGGELNSLPCPAMSTASLAISMSRLCGYARDWLPVNTTACDSILDIVNQILNATVCEEGCEEQVTHVADALRITVAEPTQQSDMLLSVLASFFEEVANVSDGMDTSTQVVEGLLNSLSSLQQWQPDLLASSGSTSRIVMSFETTAVAFSQQLESTAVNITIPNQITFVAENRMVESLKLSGIKLQFGNNEFERRQEDTSSPLAPQEAASVSLPPEVFSSIQHTTQVGFFFALYSMSTLFPLRDAEDEALAEMPQGPMDPPQRAIASAVLAAAVSSDLFFSNTTPAIQMRLRLTGIAEGDFAVPGSEVCVFWDYSAAGGRGNWSSDGCTRVSVTANVVTCQCSHLTNFAILVDICSRSVGECETNLAVQQFLSFITYIGVAFSLLGLILSIVTMVIFKRIRKRDASKYHVQLCVALFSMMLVFVTGIEQTDVYGACVSVSVLIHYFTLASIFWMAAEALLMFRKLVFVFKRTTNNFIIVVSIACWAVPLVPVLVPFIVDLGLGSDPSTDLIIRRPGFCFLSNSIVFWAAFMGPIFAVLLLNCVLCVVVIGVLIKHARSTLARRKENINTKTTLRIMASIGSIMCLFGLTWLFGALTLTMPHLHKTAQILFTIFNSFQGVFLFLFFCVLNLDARESWKELLSCGRYKSKVLRPHIRSSNSDSGAHHRVHSASSSVTRGTTGTGTGRVTQGFVLSKATYPSTDMLDEMSQYTSKITSPLQQDIATHTFTADTPPIPTDATPTFTVPNPTFPAGQDTQPGGQDTQPGGQVRGRGKPMKARVKRYSTMRAGHHVEEYQVDFYESSSDEEVAMETKY